MKQLLIALTVSAAAIVASAAPSQAASRGGPAKFYDQQGQFRGYAWCKKAGMDIVDCNYFNIAQCQATNSGFGPASCVPNPFGVYGAGDRPQRARRAY